MVEQLRSHAQGGETAIGTDGSHRAGHAGPPRAGGRARHTSFCGEVAEIIDARVGRKQSWKCRLAWKLDRHRCGYKSCDRRLFARLGRPDFRPRGHPTATHPRGVLAALRRRSAPRMPRRTKQPARPGLCVLRIGSVNARGAQAFQLGIASLSAAPTLRSRRHHWGAAQVARLEDLVGAGALEPPAGRPSVHKLERVLARAHAALGHADLTSTQTNTSVNKQLQTSRGLVAAAP